MVKKLIKDKNHIREIIAETFANDKNQSKYFIYDESKAVEHTFTQNCSMIDSHGGEFYLLSNKSGQLQGFMNVVPSLKILFSFGLKQHCRTKENKDSFIYIAEELLGENITIVLYEKNIRAIRFFENYGFNRTETNVVLNRRKNV